MAKSIEYICTVCGMKQVKGATMGKPQPGSCPRKPKYSNGKTRPHSWVKNRTIN